MWLVGKPLPPPETAYEGKVSVLVFSVTEQECKVYSCALLRLGQACVSPPPCDPSARGWGLECHCRVIGLSFSQSTDIQSLTTHAVLSFTVPRVWVSGRIEIYCMCLNSCAMNCSTMKQYFHKWSGTFIVSWTHFTHTVISVAHLMSTSDAVTSCEITLPCVTLSLFSLFTQLDTGWAWDNCSSLNVPD